MKEWGNIVKKYQRLGAEGISSHIQEGEIFKEIHGVELVRPPYNHTSSG